MRSQAFITEITDREIYAMQLVTDACATCATGCLQRGKPFAVSNRRHFPLAQGSVVTIGLSRTKRAVHGLASLFVPLACAILGYVLAPALADKIGLESTEVFKAACVIAFLAASAGIAFAISRSSIHFSKPEILQVL